MALADLDDEQASQYLPLDVWPDNWDAVQAFIAMQTQWRIGFGGPTGLDYNALPTVFDLVGIAPDARPDTFECVRVMEDEAMAVMGELSAK